MKRVIHFEIHAEEPARAAAFYSAVFGWQTKQWQGQEYWLVTTGADGVPGINGGIVKRHTAAPVPGQATNAFVCTIDVPNVDKAGESIEANGGIVVVPKMPIPGVGWLAYALDSESNTFGIMQADPTAK